MASPDRQSYPRSTRSVTREPEKGVVLDTKVAPGMVVMLPGMGMSGSKEFEEFVSGCCGANTDWLQKVFPKALPRQRLPDVPSDRWFDMSLASPVMPNQLHEGLSEAVALVHDVFEKAEADGIPSSRIVVGGFSQGAVVALVAGLTYKNPLAGVCMFSGWLPAGVLKDARQWDVPILMCHGVNDTLVPPSTGAKSKQMLVDAGAQNVNFASIANTKHELGTFGQQSSLKQFVSNSIPMVQARERLVTESTDEGSVTSLRFADDFDEESDEEVMKSCTVSDECVLQ